MMVERPRKEMDQWDYYEGPPYQGSCADCTNLDLAVKIIDPDAFHPAFDDGCGAYWIGRRNIAKEKARAILFLNETPENNDGQR